MKNKRENGVRDDLKAADVFGSVCLLRVHNILWPLSEEKKKENKSVQCNNFLSQFLYHN